MTLKFQVESLDGLDEGMQSLYKKTESGYMLDVAGVVPESKFNALNQEALNAKTEAKRRRGTVERVLERLGIDSADELDGALDALTSKDKGGKTQEEIIKQIKADADAKIAETEGKLKQFQLEGAKSALHGELLKVGFHPTAASMMAEVNSKRLQLDDDGKARIMTAEGTPLAGSGADGFATYGDLAKELAAAEPDLIVDKGKGGGGKPPASGSGNAGKKFSEMTSGEKVRLKRTNPSEYNRLRDAAE